MRSLLERPVTKLRRRQPPPSVVDLLHLAFQWLFFVVFGSLAVYMTLHGASRQTLPLVSLTVAVNPFVELPPWLWMGLIAFGLALS